jgi:hypothetical protein
MAFKAYFIISIVLLVHYITFLTDPRFDKIRSYDDAVDKWQGGLAKEYESIWTSRQLPTLHLEQDFNDDNQITPLAFDPTFQLENLQDIRRVPTPVATRKGHATVRRKGDGRREG